ncbi:MAG: LPS export ABC transporter periplasmic protein LptC [Gallionella sp.]
MTFTTRVRYWLSLLPVLGLLGATYWLNQQVQPEPVQPGSSLRHDPDSIVENFSAIKLNKQGTPHFILSATKMLHYPDDDSSALEVPRLSLLAEDRPPLIATAKIGTLSSKGDELTLQGDVELLREADTQQDQLKLQTEYLHIIPGQGLASSDRAVTLVEAQTTVNAVGIELNNVNHTIKLLSNVSTVYAPSSN